MEPVLRALPVWADLLRGADIQRRSGKRQCAPLIFWMRRRKFGISVSRKLNPDLASAQAVQRFDHEKGGKASAPHEGQRAGLTLGTLGMNSQKGKIKVLVSFSNICLKKKNTTENVAKAKG